MYRSSTLILVLALSFAGSASAEKTDQIDYAKARLERRVPAIRTAGPVRIDGILDEPVWRDAPAAKGFVQNEPSEGEPASEDTEVRVLYDDQNLYFGVFAKDRDPRGIIVNELKKDFLAESGDSFEIILDTFRDERNGFWFATNPMGAKWHAQMVNEGREVNQNWDGVWASAGCRSRARWRIWRRSSPGATCGSRRTARSTCHRWPTKAPMRIPPGASTGSSA